jgi:2-polyprenyl-3-methyl-5-hydroxy-6-metoxy-1,4-benzoquinol methylase
MEHPGQSPFLGADGRLRATSALTTAPPADDATGRKPARPSRRTADMQRQDETPDRSMGEKQYYRHVRREITTLLPARMSKVLEVGCGGGDTLRWLKDRHPGVETTGVEYNPAMAEMLARNADHALIGSIDAVMPSLGAYDTILCLDVLEHLPDADSVLRSLVARLSPGGAFIISLPNISHLSVSLPLLLRRRFDYADAGLLDRTHLRFFVEASIVAMLNEAGLIIEDGGLSGMQGGRARLIDQLTLGALRHHLTKQYIFRARPGAIQPRIGWRRLERA